MLKDVLREILNSKVFSISLIAKNLNISENLVEEAVEQLSRMGYIAEDTGSYSCDTPCSGCSMKSLCNTVPLKTIMVTEKGKNLIEKD